MMGDGSGPMTGSNVSEPVSTSACTRDVTVPAHSDDVAWHHKVRESVGLSHINAICRFEGKIWLTIAYNLHTTAMNARK